MPFIINFMCGTPSCVIFADEENIRPASFTPIGEPFTKYTDPYDPDYSQLYLDATYQSYVAEVANSNAWLKFWDNALEYGVEGTRASLTLLRALCATAFSL